MMEDKLRGTFLGLAVGDALGAAIEFQAPGTFHPITTYRGHGPHPIEAGDWTDDTSMALALADSLVQQGWDLKDQASRYVAWWREGKYSVIGRCFDTGVGTRLALAKFAKSGNPRTSGNPNREASGNGSIMRLAPVPIRYASLYPDKVERLAHLAAESSLPTHASPICLSACRYLAVVLAGLIHGESRQTVLDPHWAPLRAVAEAEPFDPEIAEVVFETTYRDREPPEIQGSGYATKSLEAALWAFHNAPDFREAVLAAVNLGDDPDTTGAVCGQLAGAYWGVSGIPAEWLAGLRHRELIDPILDPLIELALRG